MVFAALVAITAAAVLALTLAASLRNSFEYSNQLAIDLAADMYGAIEGHLTPAEDLARETLEAVANGAIDPADRDAFSRWLMGGLAAAPQIRAIALVRSDLSSWSVHRGEGNIVYEAQSQADPQMIKRVFEDAMQRGGTPYWGDLVYVQDAALINYRALFDWPGGGKAMLAIAITTGDLSRFLAEQGAKTGWTGFVLLNKSQVLAHEYINRNPSALSADNPALLLSALPDPVLRRIWDGVDGTLFDKAADAGAQVRFDPPDDPTHIYIVSRTDRFGDTPWYYGAHAPIETVNTAFQRAIRSGTIALLLTGLAVLAAIWIGHRMARPLKRAAVAAQQIGQLQLDDFQPLPTSGVREFDQQAAAFNQMAEGLRSFSTYVPKQLVGLLARRGFRSDIPARSAEVTVLFTDIVGFTSQTEWMPAEKTGAMLNEHFTLLGRAITHQQGIIDKYVGDSVMAFWVPLLVDGSPPMRAVQAARTIAGLLAADNRRRVARGETPIRIRIGIHTGPALVGNIGGKDRLDFTVVGDTVNTAQRLEDYGRYVDASAECVIVASAQTVEAIPAGWPREDLGELPISGRVGAIHGWRVLPPDYGSNQSGASICLGDSLE